MEFKLPPKEYSPRYTLDDHVIKEAEELAPGLARLGCYHDRIDWESLTTAQKQELIRTHLLGLKGECAFWGALRDDPHQGIGNAEIFLETTEPTYDAELFGAEIEIKTERRKENLLYVGLRVPPQQWEKNQYDAYFSVYQNYYTPSGRDKTFCVLGFARRFEVARAKTTCYWDHEGNYHEYKWIHYHYLHSHVYLDLWDSYQKIPTLKELTYKYPPWWRRR